MGVPTVIWWLREILFSSVEHSMKLDVSKETLQETTECLYDFACLSENTHPLCLALLPLRDDGVLIKSIESRECSYKSAMGNGCICTCPVRREIWDLYWK
jgi:hypothetical protein